MKKRMCWFDLKLEGQSRINWAKPSFNNICYHPGTKTTWTFPFYSVTFNSWKWSHLGLQLTFNFPGLIVILAFEDKQNVLLLWKEDVLTTSLNMYCWKKRKLNVKIWFGSRLRKCFECSNNYCFLFGRVWSSRGNVVCSEIHSVSCIAQSEGTIWLYCNLFNYAARFSSLN